MTPKEKAQELFYKYIEVLPSRNAIIYICDVDMSKQCALIAVDEILKILPQTEYLEDIGEHIENREKTYWQEVKQEIEKL